MDNVRYAVHTRTCTFLLDEEGLCHWIVSRTGMVPPDIRGCVGAQFVACLHPELEGGLAGELVVGAAALFVKHDDESRRMVLLRSGPIAHVELRGSERAVTEGVLSDSTLDLADGPPLSRPPDVGARGGDTVPPPAGYEGDYVAAVLSGLGESTVTLTMPLYRPDAAPVLRRR